MHALGKCFRRRRRRRRRRRAARALDRAVVGDAEREAKLAALAVERRHGRALERRDARWRGTRRRATMQNARNAMPNASVVSAALQTLVYGGAASYGLYNRCAGARRRARRAKARANEMN